MPSNWFGKHSRRWVILLEHGRHFGPTAPRHPSASGASPVLNGWVRYDMMMTMMMKIVGGEEEDYILIFLQYSIMIFIHFTALLCKVLCL